MNTYIVKFNGVYLEGYALVHALTIEKAEEIAMEKLRESSLLRPDWRISVDLVDSSAPFTMIWNGDY